MYSTSGTPMMLNGGEGSAEPAVISRQDCKVVREGQAWLMK